VARPGRKLAPVLFPASIFLAALALRLIQLGTTFRSADEAAVAARILKNPGYAWMFREYYGLLINLLVKFGAALVSFLGLTLTEFWWKFPVALAGAFQAPLTYGFLKSLGAGRFGRLLGAALTAVLPLHVMQSRYLWGYEVIGVLAITLAIWALVRFFEKPTTRAGLTASLASGLYLVSHGYVLPFLPCLILLVILWAPAGSKNVFVRLWAGTKLLASKGVWVFPLLALPFCLYPVGHALRKPTRPGFYLVSHFSGFLGNIGLGIAVLLLVAAAAFIMVRSARSRTVSFLALGGAFYLAPLFFGTPADITAVRGYMLMGTMLWVWAAVLVLDGFAVKRRAGVGVGLLTAVGLLMTMWGTVESVFRVDRAFDPSLVRAERGCVFPDPGVKAAGYLLRENLAPGATVLAIHRNIEPLNLFYYFGRDGIAYYDLTLADTRRVFEADQGRADAVICEPEQREFVEASGRFELRATLSSEGRPRLHVFARPEVRLPSLEADVRELNRAYDRIYAPRVSWR
jgi:hypothetical protein